MNERFEIQKDALRKSLLSALSDAAKVVSDRAKELSSYNGGEDIKTGSDGLSVVIYTDRPDAAGVEFGTPKMAAQPFLVPALIGSEQEILEAVSDGLEIL